MNATATKIPCSLVTGGWYVASLKPYQELFGDQLLVVLHDDVVENPTSRVRAGLAADPRPPEFMPTGLEKRAVQHQTEFGAARGASNRRRATVEEGAAGAVRVLPQ